MRSEPPLGSSIMVTSRPSVDLPQPDSPTTASVFPALKVKDTPASALTMPVPPNKPAPDLVAAAQILAPRE